MPDYDVLVSNKFKPAPEELIIERKTQGYVNPETAVPEDTGMTPREIGERFAAMREAAAVERERRAAELMARDILETERMRATLIETRDRIASEKAAKERASRIKARDRKLADYRAKVAEEAIKSPRVIDLEDE